MDSCYAGVTMVTIVSRAGGGGSRADAANQDVHVPHRACVCRPLCHALKYTRYTQTVCSTLVCVSACLRVPVRVRVCVCTMASTECGCMGFHVDALDRGRIRVHTCCHGICLTLLFVHGICLTLLFVHGNPLCRRNNGRCGSQQRETGGASYYKRRLGCIPGSSYRHERRRRRGRGRGRSSLHTGRSCCEQ